MSRVCGFSMESGSRRVKKGLEARAGVIGGLCGKGRSGENSLTTERTLTNPTKRPVFKIIGTKS